MATDYTGREATVKVAQQLLTQTLLLPPDIHIVGCHWEEPGCVVLHLEAFSDGTFPGPEVNAIFKSFDYVGEFSQAVFVKWQAVS